MQTSNSPENKVQVWRKGMREKKHIVQLKSGKGIITSDVYAPLLVQQSVHGK